MILKTCKHIIFLHNNILAVLTKTNIVWNATHFIYLLMERAAGYVPKSSKQSSVLYLFNKIKVLDFFMFLLKMGCYLFSVKSITKFFLNFWLQCGQTQGLSISEVSNHDVNNYDRVIALCFHWSR